VPPCGLDSVLARDKVDVSDCLHRHDTFLFARPAQKLCEAVLHRSAKVELAVVADMAESALVEQRILAMALFQQVR
jgi:hypothetical protein